MSLVKYNNNSISSITSAGQLASGSLVPISEQTASGSASISFTTGIDSTYPIYKFEFINIHPQTDNVTFQFNMSTDGGSNYNVAKTTTFFRALHEESDGSATLGYRTGDDLAQGTSGQDLIASIGNGNDENGSGSLQIFNPSSAIFVKHFIGTTSSYWQANGELNDFIAGYGNTTSPVNAIQFFMTSGNIDSGTIKLYGIKDS